MAATAFINLRVSHEEKVKIDQAAQSMGKSRTAFILENTLQAAEEAMLDRSRFTLDSEQWEKLNSALDSPLSEEQVRGLNKLIASKAPWQD